MSYKCLADSLIDLENTNQLVRIQEEVDPYLVAAEIQRMVYEVQGPALLFEHIKNSPFQACSNLYGTTSRSEYLFRDIFEYMQQLIRLKIDPSELLKHPLGGIKTLWFAKNAIAKKTKNKDIIQQETSIQDLPLIHSWPKDGGAFITLPQVISFPIHNDHPSKANVGMYRIQLNGNQYQLNKEVGLHYQIHRGIGNHHKDYIESGKEFKISIAVGGPPAFTLASIFPLPEGLSEIMFSGLLNKRPYYYFWHDNYFIPAEVDFCITGTVRKNALKPEGPFGDHLGYYSLQHDFPILDVSHVYHKKDAIWQFTSVGRPPQEDSSFGYLIHKIVGEISKAEYPGIKEIHAVDIAGVHPLLLAIGSERYMPFRDKRPEEILTLSNLLLGKGQTSLAKYVIICSPIEETNLDTNDVINFMRYVLERVDWRFDLHFHTQTTIDTLDYSGNGLNAGSKLVIACHRYKQRELGIECPKIEINIPYIKKIALAHKGILLFEMAAFTTYEQSLLEVEEMSQALKSIELSSFPLIVLVDDIDFCLEQSSNFIWTCFTKSNPSHDIYGIDSFTQFKHWGCNGSLIIDARTKLHHAPELISDPIAEQKAKDIIYKNSQLKKFFK